MACAAKPPGPTVGPTREFPPRTQLARRVVVLPPIFPNAAIASRFQGLLQEETERWLHRLEALGQPVLLIRWDRLPEFHQTAMFQNRALRSQGAEQLLTKESVHAVLQIEWLSGAAHRDQPIDAQIALTLWDLSTVGKTFEKSLHWAPPPATAVGPLTNQDLQRLQWTSLLQSQESSLLAAISSAPWSARILRRTAEGKLFVGAGSRTGLQVGQVLAIDRRGAEVGEVRVEVLVGSDQSTAVLLSGEGDRNDQVVER